MREWINDASMLEEIQKNSDLPSKKISLQKIFGSNLTLKTREARGIPKNQWLSLAVAKENLNNSDLSTLLVRPGGIEPPLSCVPPHQMPIVRDAGIEPATFTMSM